MVKYAVTMPGKLGDALFSLPSCRYLAEKSGQPVDFYTSSYCAPMRELMEYQSCINKFIVSEEYKIKRMDMGIQPYVVPTPWGVYDTVFHLGFRRIPDKRLDHFMAESVGINPAELPEIRYELPEEANFHVHIFAPYIVLAPRGETGYKSLFLDFIELANMNLITIVQIGGQGEFIGEPTIINKNFTGKNLLDTCQLFTESMAFVGLMSAMLVLANGWSLPKIVPHDNVHWDMRHVVRSSSNHYLVNPNAEEMLEVIEGHNESN